MARLVWCEGQSIPAACLHTTRRQRSATRSSGGGPKGPPSAPPAIPPIIITPFSYHTPEPAIDPRVHLLPRRFGDHQRTSSESDRFKAKVCRAFNRRNRNTTASPLRSRQA